MTKGRHRPKNHPIGQKTRKSKKKGSESDDDSGFDGGSNGDSDDDDSDSDSDDKPSRKKGAKPIYGKRPDIKTFDGEDASKATFWLRSFINAMDTMNWTKIDKAKNFSTF